jgi:hypothetical protein
MQLVNYNVFLLANVVPLVVVVDNKVVFILYPDTKSQGVQIVEDNPTIRQTILSGFGVVHLNCTA